MSDSDSSLDTLPEPSNTLYSRASEEIFLEPSRIEIVNSTFGATESGFGVTLPVYNPVVTGFGLFLPNEQETSISLPQSSQNEFAMQISGNDSDVTLITYLIAAMEFRHSQRENKIAELERKVHEMQEIMRQYQEN